MGTLQNPADEPRPFGVNGRDDSFPQPRAHVVRFYSREPTLITQVCEFLAPPLQAENPAVVIATAPHRSAIVERLKATGLQADRLRGEGKFITLDAEETMACFLVDGRPDAERFRSTIAPVLQKAKAAARSDERAVAVFGEIVALLCARKKYKAAIRLEQLWNELLHEHSFSLLCAYPMTLFDSRKNGQAFLQLCREHSEVVPEETYPEAGEEREQLRTVALLQQRARALESETAGRKHAGKTLRRAYQEVSFEAEILQMANSGLHELAARLLRVQDEERRRIARDLNENTNQKLALLSMNIALLQTEISLQQPDVARKLWELRDGVHQISEELRTLSYVLHPPLLNEMGLESALRWYVEVFGQQSGIPVKLELPHDLGRLSYEAEIAIFRLVQECLGYVQRYRSSAPTHIFLSKPNGCVQLQIRAEGQGIAQEKPSAVESWVQNLGLCGMRERISDLGGRLEVVTRNNGTEVNAIIPNPPAGA